MASYNDTILTNNGIAILNRVLAGECTVTFTRAVSSIADYSGKTLSELQALTKLDSIEQNGVATRFDIRSKSMVSIDLLFTNKDLQSSYEIKTIGLYAQASDSDTEVLYAVSTASDPETMPAYVDQKLAKFTLTLYTKVGQADKTSITITDEGVVKSINGKIKPDANGDVSISYYSQAEVDAKLSTKADITTTEGVVKSIKLGDNPPIYSGTDGTIRLPTYTQAEVDAKLSAKADTASVTSTDEGVVKSINGKIKPDANGDVSISYYSQAEVDAKLSAKADTTSVKATADSLITSFANAQSDINTLQHKIDSITRMLGDGGVNLLTGTSNNEVTNTYPTSGFSNTLTYIMPVSADQTDYVLSFDAKSTHAGDRINCYMTAPNQVIESVSSQNVKANYPDGLIGFNLTTDWVRYWVHYTINPTDQTPTIIVGRTVSGSGSGTVSLKCVQLEHGEIATPWQPSSDAISNLQQTASKLQSDLTNAKGAISSLDSKLPQAAYVPIVSGDKTDLNDIKICGFYLLQGETSNNPVYGWTYVKVLGIPTRLTQFVWQDINPSQQWCRWYDGSNWTPWTHYTQAL